MDYKQKVKETIHSSAVEKEMLRAVIQLRNKGRSWEWLYYAIARKEDEVWKKHGMGLLFHPPYQAQIDVMFIDELPPLTPEQERERKEDYWTYLDGLNERELAEEGVRWEREQEEKRGKEK